MTFEEMARQPQVVYNPPPVSADDVAERRRRIETFRAIFAMFGGSDDGEVTWAVHRCVAMDDEQVRVLLDFARRGDEAGFRDMLGCFGHLSKADEIWEGLSRWRAVQARKRGEQVPEQVPTRAVSTWTELEPPVNNAPILFGAPRSFRVVIVDDPVVPANEVRFVQRGIELLRVTGLTLPEAEPEGGHLVPPYMRSDLVQAMADLSRIDAAVEEANANDLEGTDDGER